jgi:hypothetical protein
MREVPYLRPVPEATERLWEAEERVEQRTAQLSLFSFSSPKTIAVAVMDVMSGGRFAALVANLRPTLVVDVRPYPRFDVPGYDRAEAFRDFRRVHARYVHVASVESGASDLVEPTRRAASTERPPSGPILVLCATPSSAEPLLGQLISAGQATCREGWSIQIEG